MKFNINKQRLTNLITQTILEATETKRDLMCFYNRNNPLSVALRNLSEGKLNEGYYSTYPIETVLKYIRDIFGNQIIGDEVLQKNNSYLIIIRIPKNVDSTKLDQAMTLCGYHVAFDGRNSDEFKYKNYVDIQYAPRYSDKVDDILVSQKYLYHVSPTNFKSKILQKGLVPNSKNSELEYPGRVHLFKERDTETGHRISNNKLVEYATVLYQAMDDIENEKDTRYADNRSSWTAYKIDVTKLPEGIKFYDDTTWWNNDAIWTYDNIPPSAIVGTMDFFL